MKVPHIDVGPDHAAAKPAHEKSASAKKAAATRAKNMGPRDDVKPAETGQPQVWHDDCPTSEPGLSSNRVCTAMPRFSILTISHLSHRSSGLRAERSASYSSAVTGNQLLSA